MPILRKRFRVGNAPTIKDNVIQPCAIPATGLICQIVEARLRTSQASRVAQVVALVSVSGSLAQAREHRRSPVIGGQESQ